MRRIGFLALSVSFAFGGLARHAPGDVKVEKKKAIVETREFDPRNPPKEMPPLKDNELAVTSTQFDFSTSLAYTPTKRDLRGGKCRMTYHVERVKAPIAMHVIIWLPPHADDRIKVHEEGHRRISEYYYKDAERSAKTAAGKLDGRRFEGEGDNCVKAADDALNAATLAASQIYMDMTSHRAQRANDLYDEITAHGTIPGMDNLAMVDKAIKLEAADAQNRKGAGTTGPAATRPAQKPTSPGPVGREK